MNSQFKRIIKLAKRTGDRIIVFDSENPEEAYAVMNIDEYERIFEKTNDIRDLTEDELLDKINRDIALWKNEQNDDEKVDIEAGEELKNELKKAKKSWSIPKERKEAAEEIIEEDRQYLEEVNY